MVQAGFARLELEFRLFSLEFGDGEVTGVMAINRKLGQLGEVSFSSYMVHSH